MFRDWDRDDMWPVETDEHGLKWWLGCLVLAAALAVLLGLGGCMTVNIDHVTLTDHSSMTVNNPKTVTTTTDASIPAGALGL